jgi:hypothetical protein
MGILPGHVYSRLTLDTAAAIAILPLYLMASQTQFEELLTGLTDEELALLYPITRRNLRDAMREGNEALAFMLAADIPVITAEIERRKANP